MKKAGEVLEFWKFPLLIGVWTGVAMAFMNGDLPRAFAGVFGG